MINFAIIGYGKMGQIRANVLSSFENINISKIYNLDPVDSHYIQVDDYSEILEDKAIDAVVICMPNKFNFEITVQSLKNNKHVFCEKPPAFTSSEVSEVIKAEKKSNKKLMYGFNHRHHDSIIEMKEVVESGDFGKILWMRGRYGKSVDASFYDDWRSQRDLSGGGILLDQGIHMLDLFLYLGGDFDKVHAFVSNLYWNLDGIEDNVFAIMKNSKSGMVASLHSTMTQWRHLFSLEVFLENGYLVLNGLKTSSGTYGDEELVIARNRSKAPAATWSDEERHIYKTDNSWLHEMEHFVDSISKDTSVKIGNSSDAHNVMLQLEKIYDSELDRSDNLYKDLK
jgi:1,5-anhydro-D-fructose reductase (1,5-anhydro-D-mannitol-forming)